MKQSTRFMIFVVVAGFCVGYSQANGSVALSEGFLILITCILFWGLTTIIEVLEDGKNKL